jgi:hypothetical protein
LAENIEELKSITEPINREIRWSNLRRKRMSKLPIRGISREWAKALFSVPSVSVVKQGFQAQL